MDPPIFWWSCSTLLLHDLPTPCFLCIVFDCLFRVAPRQRPRVPERLVPSCGFVHIVFSVLYALSGASHFLRSFELSENLLVDPIFGWLR